MTHSTVARAALLLLAVSAFGGAASAGEPAAGRPDFSGYWHLAVDSRKIPAAQLLPRVTPAMLGEHVKKDAHAVRWCNVLGLPFVMDSGEPLNIQQGVREIFMYPMASVAPRHLYLDRSKHIDSEEYDPSTAGDSIASWDGDTLVVDTVGFSDTRGITSIPGGGFRTEKSHLVERFRLLEKGAVLSVVSTWTDPTVFRAPHSYEYRYYRLPDTYEPTVKTPCDAYDEERSRFLEGAGK